MKKKLPEFKTDEEAEAFVDEADLSQCDLSGMKPVSFAGKQGTEHVFKIDLENNRGLSLIYSLIY